MENTPHLYDTLVHVLSQHAKWVDQRHLKTLEWMMVGLIQSGWISLTAWPPYVVSRARDAQSTVRRFRRWLDNDKIDVLSLYGPLCSKRWRSGASRRFMWPWTPRCCGIRTV